MKKISIILLMLLGLNLHGQIDAGKLMFGGNISYSRSTGESEFTSGGTTITSENPTSSSFNLVPQLGFMLNSSLAVGVNLGYSRYSYKYLSGFAGEDRKYYQKTGLFVFSPYARTYKRTGEKAFAFTEIGFPLSFGARNSNNWKYDDNLDVVEVEANPVKLSSIGVNLNLGFNYFINDKCALEAKWMAISYGINKEKVESNDYTSIDKDKYFYAGLNTTSLSLGLRIFF